VKEIDPEVFSFAKEKEQVLESMLESERALSLRFTAFMQHPYCDWFLQTACNYLEAYLSFSRFEMKIAAKERIRWGALGRAPTMKRPVTPLSAYSSPERKKGKSPPQSETGGATSLTPRPSPAVSDRASKDMEKKLESECENTLKQLSMIYMQIMLDFSDFDKADEDNEFFELLFNFVSTAIRLGYGVRAQKQAEVELYRVFFNMFNTAARKYKNDPHVRDFGVRKVKLKTRLGHPYDVAKERSPMMQLLLPTAKEDFTRRGYGRAQTARQMTRRPTRPKSTAAVPTPPAKPSPKTRLQDATRHVRLVTLPGMKSGAASERSSFIGSTFQTEVRTPRQRMEDGTHPSLNL